MKQEHDVVQYSDITLCTACGQSWDTNDPNPPECTSKSHANLGDHVVEQDGDKYHCIFCDKRWLMSARVPACRKNRPPDYFPMITAMIGILISVGAMIWFFGGALIQFIRVGV